MKYTIRVEYKTGDSFSDGDESIDLDEWENLDIAKENLQRIKEHYEYYRFKNDPWAGDKIEEKWKNKNLPDFIVLQMNGNIISIKIKMDNGKEYTLYPQWCGYFETLYGASIVIKEDKDISFHIN